MRDSNNDRLTKIVGVPLTVRSLLAILETNPKLRASVREAAAGLASNEKGGTDD